MIGKCRTCGRQYIVCRVCGHQYCGGAWRSCGRCNSDGPPNMRNPRECHSPEKRTTFINPSHAEYWKSESKLCLEQTLENLNNVETQTNDEDQMVSQAKIGVRRALRLYHQ